MRLLIYCACCYRRLAGPCRPNDERRIRFAKMHSALNQTAHCVALRPVADERGLFIAQPTEQELLRVLDVLAGWRRLRGRGRWHNAGLKGNAKLQTVMRMPTDESCLCLGLSHSRSKAREFA